MEEFIGNLESNEGLSSSSSHCEEYAFLFFCYGVEDLVDGNLLIVPGNLLSVIV